MASACQTEVNLYRRAATTDQRDHRPRPYELQPRRRADRAAVVDRPQPPEYPDPYRDRSPDPRRLHRRARPRSEEHTSELQSLMRISYAVFCLKKKTKTKKKNNNNNRTINNIISNTTRK